MITAAHCIFQPPNPGPDCQKGEASRMCKDNSLLCQVKGCNHCIRPVLVNFLSVVLQVVNPNTKSVVIGEHNIEDNNRDDPNR